MPTVTATEEKARAGVKITTNQLTTIQVRTVSMELLVGGPYADHPYGHTALRLISDSDDRTFDYGRYGQTWGVGKSEGEGILNIWNNFDQYIAEENALKRVTTGYLYDITEEKAAAIDRFYKAKIGGKQPRSKDRYKRTYLIENYYALGPNCTTLSLSAAKVALPDIDRDWKTYQDGRGLSFAEKGLVSVRGWPRYTFMPGDANALLAGTSVVKPKRVKTYGATK